MASLLPWFDAHLDLAYLAVSGRDMLAPLDRGAEPHAPAAVTLEELKPDAGRGWGGVRFALATVFAEPDGTGPEGYPAGDVERAYRVGRAQLEVYLTWRDRGLVALDLGRVLRSEPGVGEIRGGMGVAEAVEAPIGRRVERALSRRGPALHFGVLIENADPVRSPGELGWWVERGVVAVGLAWAKPSRYAGGNSTQLGLTDLGREMVAEMDRLGVVHDVSHLSDRALEELLGATDRAVIASHSNCRSLLGGGGVGENQRHLRDETIAEIGRRGGVVGLNLFSRFLRAGIGEGERATVGECIAHVEHVCGVMGHRRGVGLGSDMDGGFSAASLPGGINRPRDLGRLAEGLRGRGWSDEEIEWFAWGNWARFWANASDYDPAWASR